MREAFRRFAGAITAAVGTPWALLLAIGIVAAWGLSGPVFGLSDTWQLAINTGTTIVTFLMVFVIQASQNRDSKAIQLKLDEPIRAGRNARNELIDVENAPAEAAARTTALGDDGPSHAPDALPRGRGAAIIGA